MTDVQDLVDEASMLLDAPVTLEDRRFRLLAFGAHSGAADSVRVETVMGRGASAATRAWFESFGIAQAEGPVHVSADPERGTAARLCIPARWHGVVQGYLWAVEPPEGLAVERVMAAEEIATQAAEVLARLASRQRETERLVHNLLETASGGSSARELADNLAITAATSAVVAVIGAEPGTRLSADLVLGPGSVPRRVGVAERGGDLVLVVPTGSKGFDAEEVAASILTILDRAGITAVAGLGDPGQLSEAATSYRQGQACLRVLRSQIADAPRPVRSRVYSWAGLGVQRLLGGDVGDALLDAVRTPAVTELLSATAELQETAAIYLDEAGSVAATATRLNLHRQSVYHRLQRIEAITGLDLSRGRDRLELHLGLLVNAGEARA